jgi:MFS family permease
MALAAISLPSIWHSVPLFGFAAAVGLPTLRRLTPPGTLVARPGLPAAVAVMALLSAAFFGVEVFVPLALTEVRGQSAAIAGTALTASTVTWTLGAWLQARLAPRHSRRVLVCAGLAILAAGIAATACVLLPGVPPLLACATWGVGGLGMGLGYSTTSLVVLESAPAGQEGEASASLQLANVLGTAVGTGLGGAVLAQLRAGGESPALAIAVADTVAVAMAVLGIAAGARLPGRPTRAGA